MKKKRWGAFFFKEGMLKIIRVMKLVSFFLLVGFLQVTANIYSQTANIYLSLRETALSDVIKEIQKQTEFTFFYSPEDVNGIVVSEVKMEKASLEKVLDLCLKGTSLEYEIVYKAVILKKAKEIEKEPSNGLQKEPPLQQPQKKELKGKVVDSKGEPIPGTTVIVKGTTIGTITEGDGSFSILVPLDAKTLVFSFVGFNPQEITIGTKNSFNISLEEMTVGLEEVVAVGYGQQKKMTVTGAVANVSNEKLISSPVASVSNALVGKIPGLLSQQNSGEPGSDASTLHIRGIGTFSGSTDPLIMVDGIEAQSFNNIDPNEIENVSVLKDASATAVYGVRGANGVILITTKRGAIGKPQISFSANFARCDFIDIRKRVNAFEFANGYEQAIRYDSYVSGGYVSKFTPEDLELYANHQDPIFHPDVDWISMMLKNHSFQNQQNLNIKGGTERVKYFISLGRFHQGGLFNNTHMQEDFFDMQTIFDRYNFRSNFDFNVNKQLSLKVNISSRMQTKTGTTDSDASSLIRSLNIANPITSPGVVDGKFVDVQAPIMTSGQINPILYWYQKGYAKNYANYLDGSIRLDYDLDFITKGFSVHGTMSYNNVNSQRLTYTKNILSYTAIKEPVSGKAIIVQNNSEGPFSTGESSGKSRYTYAEFGLDYNRTLGSHSLNSLLLYNQSKRFDPSYQYLIPKGYQGLVGRVAYDFKNRYLAEFNLGYNGTENFAPDKRFGFFPAYSLGWVASEESFFPKNEFVNFLKFRGSYGEVGNDQIGGDRFLYTPSSYFYGTTSSQPYGTYNWGEVGITQTTTIASYEGKIGNPVLTWERAKKSNFGFEITMFNSKLRIVADIFQEKRDNILASAQTVPDLFGPTTNLPALNIGKMENKGFDGEASFKNKIGGVHYWIDANYSYAHNTLVYKDEVYNPYTYQYVTGQRVGQNFGYLAQGYYNSWLEVTDAYRPNATLQNNYIQPGDVNLKDVNGDGKIDSYDYVPIGYSNFPEITYGFSFGADYKGFDFSILFSGVSHVTFPDESWYYSQKWGMLPEYIYDQSWSLEKYENGDLITFPRLQIGGGVSMQNDAVNTLYKIDASYLRLKNAEIGYTVKMQKWNISSVRFYINGNNIYTFVNEQMKRTYPGVDPESTGQHGNNEPYPVTRTINFGFNVNF